MSLLQKLESIVEKFHYLEERLADPELQSNMKLAVKTNKEYSDLTPIVNIYKVYKNVLDNIESTKEMLKDEDSEIREMANSELQSYQEQQTQLEEEIKVLLIPKDPEDSKDVIVEIRSGTGGDEASIFAGDLYRMYSRYFESQNWKVEILDINEGSSGGYNKISLEIFGNDVYGKLKFESGAHRVQRVPETETKGRVHTSAATVVVMPKFDIEEIDIKKDDLRTDTFRASGAGGQHVNKTESGVRFTHLPTGIAAESTDSRSQHKNRDIALQRLYVKIREEQKNKVYNEQKEKRKSLVGSGDRSDKIRTYNFPQNRLTDHRINLTLYSLDKVMAGDIEQIIEALQVAENASKMVAEDAE
jgi:peptide chain release factor 1